MKLTILYDNTTFNKSLEADWGFSCLVELPNKTILFDTGANGSILLDNMKKLDIAPSMVDDVFISHGHFDHTGGLSAFLNVNNKVNLYAPVSFRGVRNVQKVIYMDKPVQIYENIFSTGELDHIEQSMAVKTDRGLVLVVGCSHPRMQHILDAASQFGNVFAIIGGLHGFNDYKLFNEVALICPTHCTQHIIDIKTLYPEKYTKGGAGKIINL
jgi:7,8-dihydropterin-6-yl-methyl-4-(beta-D-ribofuranosyl)aminobenzene 5'-phosphate synthase